MEWVGEVHQEDEQEEIGDQDGGSGVVFGDSLAKEEGGDRGGSGDGSQTGRWKQLMSDEVQCGVCR